MDNEEKKGKKVRVRGTTQEGAIIEVKLVDEGRLGGKTIYYDVRLDSGEIFTYMRNEIIFVP